MANHNNQDQEQKFIMMGPGFGDSVAEFSGKMLIAAFLIGAAVTGVVFVVGHLIFR